MMVNSIGILSAFAEPVLHAWANILDNYFSNKLFERLVPLVFLSTLAGVLFLPVIFFLDPPSFVSLKSGAFLFVISIIEILYLYPYYWSLRHADTSIVAPLFSLGKIFVPLFAFLFIGERLNGLQYVGFFILTLSSVVLVFDVQKMRLNKAFILMLFVSVILAIQSILLKYVYMQGVGWGSSVLWMTLFQLLIAGLCMLSPKNLAGIKSSMRTVMPVAFLFIFMELLSWGGTLGSSYAIYTIPVSVGKGISSTQPIFVLIYALIFSKFRPHLFREYLGKGGVIKKAVLFILTIFGVVLIT